MAQACLQFLQIATWEAIFKLFEKVWNTHIPGNSAGTEVLVQKS